MIAILFTLLIICIVAIIGLYYRLNIFIKYYEYAEFRLAQASDRNLEEIIKLVKINRKFIDNEKLNEFMNELEKR